MVTKKFSLVDEMIELFDLTGCNRAPSAFNTDKLNMGKPTLYENDLSQSYVAEHLAWHMKLTKALTLKMVQHLKRSLKFKLIVLKR